MKRPGVEEIRNSPAFRPVKSLPFSGILPFVLSNIRQRNLYTLGFAILSIAGLTALTGISISALSSGRIAFGSWFSAFMWGSLAGGVLIIPVHEGLHALGFLLIGARKIRFGADLSQAIVYATAKDFAAGRKGFSLVALAPVAVINLASLPFIFGGSARMQVFLLTMLFLHNIMCIGDFAMLSFFRQHKEKELYTFDDTDTLTAWFYERIPSGEQDQQTRDQ